MAGMRLAGQMLVHQVHPGKIAVDATASVISNILLWQARPKPALAVRILLPVAGAAIVTAGWSHAAWPRASAYRAPAGLPPDPTAAVASRT